MNLRGFEFGCLRLKQVQFDLNNLKYYLVDLFREKPKMSTLQVPCKTYAFQLKALSNLKWFQKLWVQSSLLKESQINKGYVPTKDALQEQSPKRF